MPEERKQILFNILNKFNIITKENLKKEDVDIRELLRKHRHAMNARLKREDTYPLEDEDIQYMTRKLREYAESKSNRSRNSSSSSSYQKASVATELLFGI